MDDLTEKLESLQEFKKLKNLSMERICKSIGECYNILIQHLPVNTTSVSVQFSEIQSQQEHAVITQRLAHSILYGIIAKKYDFSNLNRVNLGIYALSTDEELLIIMNGFTAIESLSIDGSHFETPSWPAAATIKLKYDDQILQVSSWTYKIRHLLES